MTNATNPPSLPPPAPPALLTEPTSPPPRRRVWVVAGAVALGVLGAGAVVSVTLGSDGGGAASPEAAVRGLAGALDQEDLLAALTFIAPDEAQGADEVVQAMQDGGDSLTGFLGDQGFDVDVHVEVIDVDVTPLADDAAHATASLRVGATVDGIPDLLGAELAQEELDLMARGEEIEVPLVTIRLGDSWYVSPILSVADVAVAQAGLAPGDWSALDAPRSPAPPDATAAVTDVIEGLAALDLDRVENALGPAEARAMRVFRAAIEEQASGSDTGAVEVTGVTTEDRGGGVVAVTGLTATSDDGSVTTLDEHACVTTSWDDDEQVVCLFDPSSWLLFGTGSPDPAATDGEPITIVTASEGGGVRILAVPTIAGFIERWIGGFDLDSLEEQMAGIEEDLGSSLEDLGGMGDTGPFPEEAATQLAMGEVVQGTLPPGGHAIYELDVPAGTEYGATVVDVAADGSTSYSTAMVITYVREDGEWVETYGGKPEAADTPIRLRVVVSDLMVAEGLSFALAVQPVVEQAVDAPGPVTVSLAPLQSAWLTTAFAVDGATSGADGVEAYAEGSSGEPGNEVQVHSYSLVAVEAVVDIVAAVPPVELEAVLSEGQPVVVDLTASTSVVRASLPAGATVTLVLTPDADQDVSLESQDGSCYADSGMRGEVERCEITVPDSGELRLVVRGFEVTDRTGTATLEVRSGR